MSQVSNMQSKDKKRAAVLIALSAVLLVMFGRLFLSRGPAPASATTDTPAAAAPPVQAATGLEVTQWPEVTMDWPPTLAHDPFNLDQLLPAEEEAGTADAPQTTAEVGAATAARRERIKLEAERVLKLKGTIMQGEAQAIVNDHPCRVGDTVEGFEILAIHGRGIVAVKEGVKVELGL